MHLNKKETQKSEIYFQKKKKKIYENFYYFAIKYNSIKHMKCTVHFKLHKKIKLLLFLY